MGRGKSSIVHDVKTAINELDRIGQSKRELRKEGKHGIHSLKQKKETLSASQNYVKWVRKEYGVKSIYELKKEHYEAYMGFLEREGRSVGHRRNVETALRHLQKGMDLRSEKFGKEKNVFVPSKRVTDWKEVKKPTNRSYSKEEYQKILKNLPVNSRDAVMLCRELGLRVREAVRVEVQHFQPTDSGWQLIIEDGKGITKGGRFRELVVPDHFKGQLERMINEKKGHERLVTVERDTVRRAVNEACRKARIIQNARGTHGFRHAYSRERVNLLFKERGIPETGPKMVERIMSNRDQGRLANYGIVSDRDKVLFEQVKQVIDKVHQEIGHGKDRWDLAAVYMR
ncbi:site-specific integrase [Bacillus velezensis]